MTKEKSRKAISKKRNKSEKHGTHKATARRKDEKTRDLLQIKAGFQKDRHKFVKKWIFFGKKSNTEMKKNWWRNKKRRMRSRTKERKEKWVQTKKKRRKNGDEEKC